MPATDFGDGVRDPLPAGASAAQTVPLMNSPVQGPESFPAEKGPNQGVAVCWPGGATGVRRGPLPLGSSDGRRPTPPSRGVSGAWDKKGAGSGGGAPRGPAAKEDQGRYRQSRME